MLFFIPAAAMIHPWVGSDPGMTLREAAAKRHLLFGTAISAGYLSEPNYADVAGREFSQAEPENEMKFSSLHPRPDTDPEPYDFRGADAIVKFAELHRMKVRGHCLVWYQQVSRWVTANHYQPADLSKILHDHIQTVTRRYAGKVYAWDVVNEAFQDDGSTRHMVWFDRPGIGLPSGIATIEQAFRWAHESDRHAKLFYNDYGCETINRKSDAIYAMVQDFKKRRVPINGVGFQMHWGLWANNPKTLQSMNDNLRRFAALGVDVQITELDVSLPNSNSESLAQEADLYHSIVEICLGVPRCTAIQTWGFTDKHSWIPMVSGGRNGWALLFDSDYRPKPSYDAVLSALEDTHSSHSNGSK